MATKAVGTLRLPGFIVDQTCLAHAATQVKVGESLNNLGLHGGGAPLHLPSFSLAVLVLLISLSQ